MSLFIYNVIRIIIIQIIGSEMLVAVLMDEVGVMCEQIGLFKCVNMSVSK